MRLQLLLISLASIFILSHGSPEDVNNIHKVNNDFAVFFDNKRYSSILPLFTANATFSIFTKTRGNFTIQGSKEVVRIISAFTTYTTQISLTTQSYTLLPPFDSLGGAGEATSESAFNPAVFDNDKAQFFYAKLVDKYVKTPDFAQYGGWKIEQRSFTLLVSFHHHGSRLRLVTPVAFRGVWDSNSAMNRHHLVGTISLTYPLLMPSKSEGK